ncbi:TraB/VirB10 family protein [Rugamonas aquatica]|uniref:Conjugal transfer protein TraB n=1 Tax=Rugamonas aquatica TaxID=2743357 RepID=A0A6A7N6D2_9BURK|nr:TraB/VirB10 family protein [Rugamonas aquatica]MQA40596.1 conjugal transfer protein TraB [Rugamonas aquatica]
MTMRSRLSESVARLPVKHRQYLLAALLCCVGVGALYVTIWLGTPARTERGASAPRKSARGHSVAKVLAPGSISPEEEWLGTAGRKLDQFETERQDQERRNTENKAFQAQVLQHFAELDRKQAEQAQKLAQGGAAPPAPPSPAQPPSRPVSTPARPGGFSMPPGAPPGAGGEDGGGPGANTTPVGIQPNLTRIAVPAPAPAPATRNDNGKGEPVRSYLPVSFAHGVLLGGVDAPTGGQSQSNPLPVMIRLTDNAVLPNRYRAQVKECLVVASVYGDISSERAYGRTVNLSCIRHDGTALEVPIKGNLYGEDGKLGLRGRLVSKQGQLLANALRAGIVGGIGQGFSQSGTTFSSSPLGSVATQGGSEAELMKRGVASGVGRALDNLANYYIRLAEQTFPVIEIDGARAVDVALTQGVRLEMDAGIDGDGTPDVPEDRRDTYAK